MDGSVGLDGKKKREDASCSDPPSIRALLSVLHSNRAQANLVLGNHGRMLEDAQAAVRLDAGNVKVSPVLPLRDIDALKRRRLETPLTP